MLVLCDETIMMRVVHGTTTVDGWRPGRDLQDRLRSNIPIETPEDLLSVPRFGVAQLRRLKIAAVRWYLEAMEEEVLRRFPDWQGALEEIQDACSMVEDPGYGCALNLGLALSGCVTIPMGMSPACKMGVYSTLWTNGWESGILCPDTVPKRQPWYSEGALRLIMESRRVLARDTRESING